MVIKKMAKKQYSMFDKALEIEPDHILSRTWEKVIRSPNDSENN